MTVQASSCVSAPIAGGTAYDPLIFPEVAARWLYASKDKQHLPHAVEAALEQHRISQKTTVSEKQHVSLEHYHALVEQDLNGKKGFKARRDAEQALAAYIRQQVVPVASIGEITRLESIAEAMAACRTSGQHGIAINGVGQYVENRFMWTQKCRKAKLCPDESRLEGVRIAEKYLPHIENWIDAGKNRRVFYLVITKPNYPIGALHDGKREMFRDFYNLLERLRSNKKLRKKIADIHGALAVQEDPLSAAGSWNIHINVELLVQGPFNWAAFREEWGGYQIYFKEVPRHELADSFRELCKYQAKATSVGTEHSKTKQPGMVDWEPGLWLEWWRANDRFRRTRSYGCLYDLPELVESEEETADGGISDVSRTVWLGRMTWDGGRYWVEHFAEALQYVDLIQAYKSGKENAKTTATGPPESTADPNQPPNQPDPPQYSGDSGYGDQGLDVGVVCTGETAPF